MSRVEKFGRGSEIYVFYLKSFPGGIKEVISRRFFHPLYRAKKFNAMIHDN